MPLDTRLLSVLLLSAIGLAAPATAQVASLDAEMWALVEDSDDADLLARFIDRFPDSPFRYDAERKLAVLRGAETPPDQATLTAFYTAPEPPVIYERFRDCETCPEMVEIGPSEVIYGTPDRALRAQYDERPALRVPVARAPIAVALTETSQADFARFVAATDHPWPEACMITPRGDALPYMGTRSADTVQGDDLPVTCVSWNDAKAYTDWLSAETGEDYRLLTEIEHEYLAEALYFDTELPDRLDDRTACEVVNVADYGAPFSWRNFGCEDALGRGIFPVQSLEPDGFGLYHLLGNVWEWTESCYTDRPEPALPGSLVLIEGGEACDRRALRGGGWSDPLTSLRTSNRNWEAPDFRSDTLGFRVARDP